MKAFLKKHFPALIPYVRKLRTTTDKLIWRLIAAFPCFRALATRCGFFCQKLYIGSILDTCKKEGEVLQLLDNEIRYEIIGEQDSAEEIEQHRDRAPRVPVSCAPVYVGKLRDVTVVGNSDFIIKDNRYLTDRVCWDELGIYRNPHTSIKKCKKGEPLLLAGKKHSEIIEKGIFLQGRWSLNYYHWTIDILPRIRYVDELRDYENIPLLISKEGCRDDKNVGLLKQFNKFNRPIIYLEEGVFYQVKELIYPSQNTWPFWDYRGEDRAAIGAYHPKCMEIIREYVLGERENHSTEKKVYITRGDNRRLVNESEIEKCFESSGFEIVNPNNMTLEQEIEVFAQAKIVVGVVGAAFTNMVYCKSGTLIAQICPASYQLISAEGLAQACGLRFQYICADLTTGSSSLSTSTFFLPQDHCMEMIKLCGMDE